MLIVQTALSYLPWGFASVTAWASPAASVWTLYLSGEQWTQVAIRLIDTLPAVLMALAALVTAAKARREAREATIKASANEKENA
ncbi:MAG: hypothetical protein H7Y38_08880 [Armatimonadetes bacterium]|nr:hypothetical protein [Armatimonadota bacterium]